MTIFIYESVINLFPSDIDIICKVLGLDRVVAQLVVHLVWDQDVAGSSPVYPTASQ